MSGGATGRTNKTSTKGAGKTLLGTAKSAKYALDSCQIVPHKHVK